METKHENEKLCFCWVLNTQENLSCVYTHVRKDICMHANVRINYTPLARRKYVQKGVQCVVMQLFNDWLRIAY